jgi:hypothetical protein
VSPPRPPKTPFDLAIEAEYDGIMRLLKYACGRRGLRGEDIGDAIGETFRVACEREIDGPRWDPEVQAIPLHLVGILDNHLQGQRRKVVRRPKTTSLEKEHDAASENANIEEAIEELEDEEGRSNEVRKVLAAETKAGLTLRILDALRKGLRSHDQLAKELKVPLPDVRNAFRRIVRRTTELRAKSPKGKGP